MKSPLVIVGPTSSGKTALSLWLAEQMGDTDILVVDSKQVYTEQDIVTGKDVPTKTRARVFGIDLVAPDEEWSVSLFLKYAKKVIENAVTENRQLIIVGGTPQFTLALFDPPQSVNVPVNSVLRAKLETESIESLQEKLRTLDSKRFESMNRSDQQNPRRLVRAIEIHSHLGNHTPPTWSRGLLKMRDSFWIGLTMDKSTLEQRIQQRVKDRLENNAIDEYKKIRETYPDWTKEAKAAIGYSEIEQFLTSKMDKGRLIDLWTLHEVQYAKRQMTWWKREPQIRWFDALDPDLNSQVLLALKDCYNEDI